MVIFGTKIANYIQWKSDYFQLFDDFQKHFRPLQQTLDKFQPQIMSKIAFQALLASGKSDPSRILYLYIKSVLEMKENWSRSARQLLS